MCAAHSKHHHMIKQWFQRLGYERLQFVGFNRQFTEFRHAPESRGVSRNCEADFFRPNHSSARLQTGDCASVALDACDFTVLKNVDPLLVCPTGVAPRDGVMSGGAGTRLRHRTDDREAGIG